METPLEKPWAEHYNEGKIQPCFKATGKGNNFPLKILVFPLSHIVQGTALLWIWPSHKKESFQISLQPLAPDGHRSYIFKVIKILEEFLWMIRNYKKIHLQTPVSRDKRHAHLNPADRKI